MGAFTKMKTMCHVHKANQIDSVVYLGGTLGMDEGSSKEALVMLQAGATSWRRDR